MPDIAWKNILEKELDTSFSNLRKIPRNMLISSELENEILKLDENSLHNTFKFGVLFIKENQTQEEEWFSNQHDSESFDKFLSIIGEKTKLQGYDGFAAGLDTKSGDCGEYTYTKVWNDNKIAYHVSSLIPSKPGDEQQIQRKRHIGNDIVCIIFVEGNQPFNPLAIKSQFLHVFIVVHEELYLDKKVWRVEIVRLEDVPAFGPSLPEKALFFNEDELSKFLIAKLVNAEYAAMKSRKLSHFQARPREGIFMNIVEKGVKLSNEANEAATIHNHITRKFHAKSASSGSSITSSSKSIKPMAGSTNKEYPFYTTNTASIDYDGILQDYQQFPSFHEFDAIVNDYLQNLSSKKRDKALVDTGRYALILQVLKDPRNTAISTAQFRFWVKKMFKLVIANNTEIVCHDDKPVATRESIYDILIYAHKEAHHGGRDKTSALVRRRYSWIPKELIARFVRHCPFCISRRNGCQSPSIISGLPKTPP
ncbi:hypothetical protein BDB01DRAFT_724338, partial [Pilobolus umbonatus]